MTIDEQIQAKVDEGMHIYEAFSAVQASYTKDMDLPDDGKWLVFHRAVQTERMTAYLAKADQAQLANALGAFILGWAHDPIEAGSSLELDCDEVDGLAFLLNELGATGPAKQWLAFHALDEEEGGRHFELRGEAEEYAGLNGPLQ